MPRARRSDAAPLDAKACVAHGECLRWEETGWQGREGFWERLAFEQQAAESRRYLDHELQQHGFSAGLSGEDGGIILDPKQHGCG